MLFSVSSHLEMHSRINSLDVFGNKITFSLSPFQDK